MYSRLHPGAVRHLLAGGRSGHSPRLSRSRGPGGADMNPLRDSQEDAARALEMRESGATYQQIADQLCISKGKTHHLVRLAREELDSDLEGPSVRLTSEDRK